ncbi:carbohydrate-binding module family 1 protein [Phanerochaete carnosa HHB-10118-sp]|uniref:Carbohydrate-binding module family 1 protein n=1 Tax=Phanerochaete carnosa (strain HHB-10118-sp) TaxID=650164 RepID=K5VUG7_PHACS|nr:carbohydrate-binding module family 1 protein [Phanerochaete carnosa HHB-10118-sp]EKM55178.1 carbohydrate-binding module family 1 protein [Phanerochaete carnosa HHB-10118-sp]
MAVFKSLLAALTGAVFVLAQSATQYVDSFSGITFLGYTDPELDVTVGFVLPPLSTPPSNEYIVQLVAPVTNGYTGLSVGGTMADSLLFTLWPYDNEIILGPRWTSGYVLPLAYAGPQITLLPSSAVNSTHIRATFRCQNCTTWEDGSLGNGDLTSDSVVAYVVATTTQPSDPADVDSVIQEHDDFDFFGLDLSSAHSDSYSSYISGSATTSAVPTTTGLPSTTSSIPSTTSSAPTAVQTECGGTGYTGPTVCASGLTCVAVSAPYYSQCQS